MQVIDDYLINAETFIIEPIYGEFGQLFSKVHEERGSYIVKKKPINLIKESCLYYGAGYKGRLDSSIKATGFQKKVPICIFEGQKIFFFPLGSPNNDDSSWVAHYHVEKVTSIGPQLSYIYFMNRLKIEVPFSKAVIEGEVMRTAQLRFIMLKRWNEEN
ncbi:hypothetical protein AJ85_14180 [Alkalihalobacillus alcalophilus ATCC 27647 = CGMCC 1.3604]|uniref:Competence protein n=1 Tax=Alkalihalobacillus alcalophilus ATCC 27647 = CGMCC 1.3604 TaxID=1218173 RepID=A0A094WLE9_ALKAL|nr:competence protein ComK [Alkalihalobacillus alcalophilus]KGA96733.1 hypothetical protein BALCAV_0214315 [Alkalihalobacillus alcalophilus ATCC 27647 = CGMCC 1.3604]MED1563802.1 competence protein ComK [Alkalihalobacillus alcalophilus]THG92224.1 hypothetical protein AJ85_14180 [Alkalihalobacillus alcalophilus ATCC 27647 = CGMCC 1.3604]